MKPFNPSDFVPATHPTPAEMAAGFDLDREAYAAGIATERARLAAMLLGVTKALLGASKSAGATPDGFRAQGAAEAYLVLGQELAK